MPRVGSCRGRAHAARLRLPQRARNGRRSTASVGSACAACGGRALGVQYKGAARAGASAALRPGAAGDPRKALYAGQLE
eukprot:scaffold4516_cov417-Prasinococcus_capsulatus_cf.AAC.9